MKLMTLEDMSVYVYEFDIEDNNPDTCTVTITLENNDDNLVEISNIENNKYRIDTNVLPPVMHGKIVKVKIRVINSIGNSTEYEELWRIKRKSKK